VYWHLVPAFPPCVVCVFSRVVGRCSPVLSYVLYIYVPALFLLLLFSSSFYIVIVLFSVPFLFFLCVSFYVDVFVTVVVFVVAVTAAVTVI
jgi:hypothetical protein